jgi:hypothetical protein
MSLGTVGLGGVPAPSTVSGVVQSSTRVQQLGVSPSKCLMSSGVHVDNAPSSVDGRNMGPLFQWQYTSHGGAGYMVVLFHETMGPCYPPPHLSSSNTSRGFMFPTKEQPLEPQPGALVHREFRRVFHPLFGVSATPAPIEPPVTMASILGPASANPILSMQSFSV